MVPPSSFCDLSVLTIGRRQLQAAGANVALLLFNFSIKAVISQAGMPSKLWKSVASLLSVKVYLNASERNSLGDPAVP